MTRDVSMLGLTQAFAAGGVAMKWQEVQLSRARRGLIEIGVVSASAATRHIVIMHEVRHSDVRVLPGWWGYLPETDTVYWAVNRGLAEEGWRAAKAAGLAP